MSEQPSPDYVESVIERFMTPNTQIIAEATQWLKDYLSMPYSIPVMYTLFCSSSKTNVRHTAGVLVRTWIIKHWSSMPDDVCGQIVDSLFNVIASEQIPNLRNTAGDLAASVARILVPQNKWPSFWSDLFQLADSTEANHREVALHMLEELITEISKETRVHSDEIYNLLLRRITGSEETPVRIAALKVTGAFLAKCKKKLASKYAPLIPLVQQCIEHGIQTNNMDEACISYSVLLDVVEGPTALLTPTFSDISKLTLQIASNPNLDFDLRQQSLVFIQWLAQFKSTFLTEFKLVDPLLELTFSMASEDNVEDGDEEDDEITPYKFAIQMLDILGRHLGASNIYIKSVDLIRNYFTSPNPAQRRAAVSALGIMSGPCCEQFAENLDDIIPYLEAAFSDPVPSVQKAACLLLANWADNLQPEFALYYEKVLPIVYNCLESSDAELQERGAYAFVSFAEHMEEEDIAPYVVQFMEKIVAILTHSTETNTREMAITAISGLAAAAKKKVLPYMNNILQILDYAITLTDDDMPLRARAVECAGVLALAVGKENFGWDNFDRYMSNVLQGYRLPKSQESALREYSVSFISNCAESLGKDFVRYLDPVVEMVLDVLASTDGVSDDNASNPLHSLTTLDDDDLDENQEYTGTLTSLNFTVGSAYVDEKHQSLHALGMVAKMVGAAFVPYIERCTNALRPVLRYIHPQIRKFAVFPMECFISSLKDAYPDNHAAWKPGQPIDQFPVAEPTMKLVDFLAQHVISCIPNDFDMAVVARYLTSLKTIAKELGPPGIEPYVAQSLHLVRMVLQGKTMSQEVEDVDDHVDDEVEQERFEMIVYSCQYLCELALAYRSDFSRFFDIIDDLVAHLSDEDPAWRQEIVGCLAEIVHCVDACTMTDDVLQSFLSVCSNVFADPAEEVISNNVYMVGLLCCNPKLRDTYEQIALTLYNLLDTSEHPHVLDNAVGALARMMMTCPDALPMQTIVDRWILRMPLKEDIQEAPVAYGLLCMFVEQQNELISNHLPHVINIFTVDVDNDEVPHDLRVRMIRIVKELWTNYSQQIEGTVNSLSAPQQENFQKCLNHE